MSLVLTRFLGQCGCYTKHVFFVNCAAGVLKELYERLNEHTPLIGIRYRIEGPEFNHVLIGTCKLNCAIKSRRSRQLRQYFNKSFHSDVFSYMLTGAQVSTEVICAQFTYFVCNRVLFKLVHFPKEKVRVSLMTQHRTFRPLSVCHFPLLYDIKFAYEAPHGD